MNVKEFLQLLTPSPVLFKRIPCCWGVWRWDTLFVVVICLLGRMLTACHLQLKSGMLQPRQRRWQPQTRTLSRRFIVSQKGKQMCRATCKACRVQFVIGLRLPWLTILMFTKHVVYLLCVNRSERVVEGLDDVMSIPRAGNNGTQR